MKPIILQIDILNKKSNKKIRLIKSKISEDESNIYYIQVEKKFLGICYWKNIVDTCDIHMANTFYTEFIKLHNILFK